MDYTLREYTQEEYIADLKKELSQKCLLKCVHERLSEINQSARPLSYTEHRYIQEKMVEIEDLIKLATE